MTALPQIVRALYSKHGYTLFDGGASFNLNIFGVRSQDYGAAGFNDRLGCLYRDAKGAQKLHLWAGTTDPGLVYRRQPKHVAGTAILSPAQNLRCWQLGMYKGRLALVQAGPIAVCRDNDKDEQLDLTGRVYRVDNAGLHLHYMGDGPPSRPVELWSAGCQGLARASDLAQLLQLAQDQIRVHPTWIWFTYTLFDVKQDPEANTLLTFPT